MKMTSATEMEGHIKELCAAHQVEVGSHSRGGRAFRKTRRVDIRPVKSAVTYAVALHEIGHILGKNQTRSCLERETGAWQWAKKRLCSGMAGWRKRCVSAWLPITGCMPPQTDDSTRH